MAAKTKLDQGEPDPRPEPVPKQVVCSICGLAWSDHGSAPSSEPTLLTCVKLLKAELAKRPPWQTWVSGPATTVAGIGGSSTWQ